MTTQLVNRPARTVHPTVAPAPTQIVAPPTLPERRSGTPLLQLLLPLVGAVSSMTMMITLRRSPLMLAAGVLMMVTAVLGAVAMVASQRGQATRTRRRQRDQYLDYLDDVRRQLRVEEARHRAAALTADPSPSDLTELIGAPSRRWERRCGDPDFLRLRIGVGDVTWRRIEVRDDSSPLQPADPFMANAARALSEQLAHLPGLPVCIDLDQAGDVALIGSRSATLGAARAIGSQLICLHSPQDVSVAIATPAEYANDWGWLLWSPHAVGDDAVGPASAPRTARTLYELTRLLDDDLKNRANLAEEARRGFLPPSGSSPGRRLVIFADHPRQNDGDASNRVEGFGRFALPDSTLELADAGVTLIHLLPDRLVEPGSVRLRVTIADDATMVVEDLRDPSRTTGQLDDVATARAEGLSRRLARFRPDTTGPRDEPAIGARDAIDVLGIGTLASNGAWPPRSPRDFLRVPIGVDDNGGTVMLDLKESAQLGMGPHGLCVGATGSGKSELLRTLVAALTTTHSPDDLALLLMDYKGGAAFAPLARLPHVCGLITNLADDPGLVERAHASLAGEVLRRQRMLKDSGDLADIGQYRQLRAASRPDLPALPHLLVVIDEFAELIGAEDEFVDLFLTIGRIGRSIGIHLLLASQRIETGRLRGLETYLSYRLALRTFSEAESTMVLEAPDAYRLPALPGFGWLKVDTSVYTRFRTAYVSGPAAASTPTPDPNPRFDPALPPTPALTPGGGAGVPTARVRHLRFYAADEAANRSDPNDPSTLVTQRTVERTVLDALVERVSVRSGSPAAPIWLEPLPSNLTLDQVIAQPTLVPGRGLQCLGDHRRGVSGLHAIIGTVDDPRRQRQYPWSLDLTASGGHVAIVGGPQSGKSNLLRSIAVSLALTYTPSEVAIYGMELGGGGMSRLRPFPHVGGVATRNDPERLNRTVTELRRMIDEREKVFRTHALDSMEQLRFAHVAGRLPDLPAADIVFLVDDAGALRNDLDDLDTAVTELITRGSGFGVHVIASVTRWNELRMSVQAAFGTRIELRLNDPADSVVNRRLAERIRPEQRGRALIELQDTSGQITAARQLFAQAALPRTDGAATSVGLLQALEAVSQRSASAWPGRRAAEIRVLPRTVRPEELPDFIDEPDLIPIGVGETTLEPAKLDLLGVDQHLLVLGDTGSGKTTLLRGIAAGVTERRAAQELVVAVVDPRLGLRGAVAEAYLGGYATSASQAEALANSIAVELSCRASQAELSLAETEAAADAPQILLLVDDYELLTAGGGQPLVPLLPFLPAARDLGLHVVLTRPVAGAARGIWDGFVQGLREAGAIGLLMDGDRSEGQLLPGLYAWRQPPGRGLLVRRGRVPELIQTPLHPPVLHPPARDEPKLRPRVPGSVNDLGVPGGVG
ncbi:DNA segregation ATPase FtsK/SpoIIIE, S-DNA-T family [Frankineae bacterium MT45]|nr:DNA segregation ATPase FtsK/SpoIIIE, S-DNA-T family [Frankineae bacterium MT45]